MNWAFAVGKAAGKVLPARFPSSAPLDQLDPAFARKLLGV